MNFDAKKDVNEIVDWLKQYLTQSGAKGFVIGISGGKDSAVVASLAVKAVGCENVIGVLMPNGVQADISDSIGVCETLGIKYETVNLSAIYEEVLKAIPSAENRETKINILPRLRMTTLYSVASEHNYLVIGTGNKSESFVGYFTKWGDGAYDLNPISQFTTEEVVKLGEELGTFKGAIYKKPSDGISGSSDEEKLGVLYSEINEFMEFGTIENKEHENIIVKRNKQNQHKLQSPPTFIRKQ